jgi:microcystin-dependent protein
MSEAFLGEIRLFSFDFPPKGWASTNGQLLPINQNQALFSLLGTTYAGNGQTNFGLPDLRNCVPIHTGGGHTLGERAGETAHTLTSPEMPAHTHTLVGSASNADVVAPAGNQPATASQLYAPAAHPVALDPSAAGPTGGSQPHTNQQPFLALNFCIALVGIFPSRN